MRVRRKPGELIVAAVVLAAGSSSRLGQPKQNAILGAETLLERAVRVAHSSNLAPVFVVSLPNLAIDSDTNVRVLINEQSSEGMASSIRIGISAVMEVGADATVILACDQPWVTEDHLRHLARGGDEIVASAYASRKGIPAYFPAKAFRDLLELRGDVGAREMLRDARSVPLKKGELDIDTAEDLKRARELYAIDPPFRAGRG